MKKYEQKKYSSNILFYLELWGVKWSINETESSLSSAACFLLFNHDSAFSNISRWELRGWELRGFDFFFIFLENRLLLDTSCLSAKQKCNVNKMTCNACIHTKSYSIGTKSNILVEFFPSSFHKNLQFQPFFHIHVFSICITFTTPWAALADDKSTIFSYFSQIFLKFLKTGFGFSCNLSQLETICTKCQILFSGKNKKHISKSLTPENFTQSVKR